MGGTAQKLTAAAAAVPNVTDSYGNVITASSTWTDVTTPINGVQYSYIRYDFNYQTDAAASYRLIAPTGSQGILIMQAGLALAESYTFNSGSVGCLVKY